MGRCNTRLKNYGAGELTDRLTILSLKILFGSEAGKDTKHFENERTLLLPEIRTRTLNGVWFAQVLELAAVNAALWHAEDDLRGYRQKTTQYDEHAAVVLAFRIQALNDTRAELVARINQDAGDAPGGEGAPKEKL